MGEFPAPLCSPERLEVVEEGKIFPCFVFDTIQNAILYGNELDENIFTDTLDLDAIKKHGSVVQKHFFALACCVAEFDAQSTIRAFSAFFVSPNIMVTARHCVESISGPPARILFQYVDRLVTTLPAFFIRRRPAGRAAILEECPVEVIKDIETGVGDISIHNFAFLKVTQWIPVESKFFSKRSPPTWIFPSVVLPKVGNYIYTIQFNGVVTDAFLNKHHDENLKQKVKSGIYLSDLLGATRPSLSAGCVKVVKPPVVVAYGSSTLLGSSGAPAFSENDLGHFCSIHYGGIYETQQAFVPHTSNNGCLVADPFFQEAYARHVPADFTESGLAVPQEVKDFITHKFE